MPEDKWLPLGTTRATILPLHQCVTTEIGYDVTVKGLMNLMPGAQIPCVKIGRRRYTKRAWVAEWLESLRIPA
ncbi:hypothetical protein BH09ACT7_BH09ACT7_37540 [soil metagenome]